MDTEKIPYQINASSDHISMKWEHKQGSFDNYIIKYRELYGKEKKNNLMATLENEITLKNLKSNTSYEIKLYIQREGEDELVFTEKADTSVSIAAQFISTAEKIKDEPTVYQFQPVRVEKINEEISINHMVSDCDDIEEENMKSVLFVGATESGKSTLLDALFNCVFNVPFADQFRFKLINDKSDQISNRKHQVTSRTKNITCYKIPQIDDCQTQFALQVIDTPGFQDRNANQNNNEITRQITELFCSGKITHINAVCIVLPSSCRLTQEQQDVFNEILSIFGNDINCFIPLVTFDDGVYTNALNTLSQAGIPFMNHMHFSFNNATLFSSNESEKAWDLRNSSLKDLLASISVYPKQSIKLTKEVLKLRQNVSSDFKSLKRYKRDLDKIHTGILKFESDVCYHERIKIENENYLYEENEIRETRREIANGIYINCQNCKLTCRTIRKTSSWSFSSIMKSLWWGIIKISSVFWGFCCFQFFFNCICCICFLFGFPERNILECNACNCMLGDHINEKAIYRKHFQKVTKTITSKQMMYDAAVESKAGLQRKIQNLKSELNQLLTKYECLIQRMRYFRSIALKCEQNCDNKEIEDAMKNMKDIHLGERL